MANRSGKPAKEKRDGAGGAVMVIPHIVLNSLAYKTETDRRKINRWMDAGRKP